MSRTHLALPHSATLAWWLTAWLRGHGAGSGVDVAAAAADALAVGAMSDDEVRELLGESR